LKALDGVSNEVCSVIDVAELCRNVHADPRFREAAEESFAQLSGYIHTLNADVSLYDRLCEVVKGGTRRNGSDGDDIFSLLSEEEQLLAQDLKAEFESDGIHLRGQDAQRAQVSSFIFIAANSGRRQLAHLATRTL
jgi:intermediate peptidase